VTDEQGFFFALLLFFSSSLEAKISYSVEYQGIEDASLLKIVKSVSQLTNLKKHQPASIQALEYRADADIPEMLKVMRAHGYYEAKIEVSLQDFSSQIYVIVAIQSGPLYKIKDFTINFYSPPKKNSILWKRLELENLGITLNKPALTTTILEAEQETAKILGQSGYPLAKIVSRDVRVDGKEKGVFVTLQIETGPICYFGPLSITGLDSVKPLFIQQTIPWKEGDLYDSQLVETTAETMLRSGLFGAAFIKPGNAPTSHNLLPIEIDVSETKHKSVNIGASYQTYWGPGVTFGWENRNVSGMGRKLSLQGDVTKRSIAGVATYLYPNFLRIGQDHLWKMEALHESIIPYNQSDYSIMSRFDRRISHRMSGSFGGKLERMIVTDSVQDGKFVLFGLPAYLRWSSANNLLNPTKGNTVEYRITPTVNFTQKKHEFLYQELSHSFYKSFDKRKILVFAQKITIGSILSREYEDVPMPNRFFGGSEEDLRGYRYFTVSPLIHGKPAGGRSAVYYTFEPRLRVSKSFGLVPFYDLGNVYKSVLPQFTGKWFSSVGFGVRYFSFMGPIRADIGFPLYRRKGLDPKCRFLVSIGQSF
jgi:translocation and assembly module TamA